MSDDRFTVTPGTPAPEKEPPGEPARKQGTLDLTDDEYLDELARRIREHARVNCRGVKAKQEIGYAADVLEIMASRIRGGV